MVIRWQGDTKGRRESGMVAGSQLSDVHMSLKTRERIKKSNKKKKLTRGGLNRDSRGRTESGGGIMRVEI